MKRLLFLFLVSLVTLVSCKKDGEMLEFDDPADSQNVQWTVAGNPFGGNPVLVDTASASRVSLRSGPLTFTIGIENLSGNETYIVEKINDTTGKVTKESNGAFVGNRAFNWLLNNSKCNKGNFRITGMDSVIRITFNFLTTDNGGNMLTNGILRVENEGQYVGYTMGSNPHVSFNLNVHTATNIEIDAADYDSKFYIAAKTNGSIWELLSTYSIVYNNVTGAVQATSSSNPSTVLNWSDFDWGFGDGVGIDTIFTTATLSILENNSTYVRGTFSASGAKRIDNSLFSDPGTPINLPLTEGYFKLRK
jgi:hypothetical protein